MNNISGSVALIHFLKHIGIPANRTVQAQHRPIHDQREDQAIGRPRDLGLVTQTGDPPQHGELSPAPHVFKLPGGEPPCTGRSNSPESYQSGGERGLIITLIMGDCKPVLVFYYI